MVVFYVTMYMRNPHIFYNLMVLYRPSYYHMESQKICNQHRLRLLHLRMYIHVR